MGNAAYGFWSASRPTMKHQNSICSELPNQEVTLTRLNKHPARIECGAETTKPHPYLATVST